MYIVRIRGLNHPIDPAGIEIHKGDGVVVRENEHLEFAVVDVMAPEHASKLCDRSSAKVLRKATPADLDQLDRRREKDREALSVARQQVEKLKLPMRLALAEHTFDFKKVVFYFTAENRVDFRELLKELTVQLRGVRIELKQVGAREEAKQFGGLGPCGRELCCSSFLRAFIPITLKMAKDQSTSLNPAKISGMCGRLMCCLSYEEQNYLNIRRALPPVGSTVQMKQGKGVVLEQQVVKNMVKVQVENQVVSVAAEEIIKVLNQKGANQQGANENNSLSASQ